MNITVLLLQQGEAMNDIHILVHLKLRWQHCTLCGGGELWSIWNLSIARS